MINMADQTILDIGLTDLITYIKTKYLYIALGNGEWGDNEKIPAATQALRNEVARITLMNVIVEGTTITFFGSFVGRDLEDTSSGTAKYVLSEIALADTSTEITSQNLLLMKVFSPITMDPGDSKVVKIVLSVGYTQTS